MRGRLPGDLNGTRQIGFGYGQSCPSSSFPDTPYYHATKQINNVSCPFVELYLAGITAFKPDPNDTGITASSLNYSLIKTNIADHGGIPFSKSYRDFIFAHRYELNNPNIYLHAQGVVGEIGIHLFLTTVNYSVANQKTVNIAKKIDVKFDDGLYDGGNIRACCNNSGCNKEYNEAIVCGEMTFFNTQLKNL
jgi:hypothetical protein